MEKYCNVQTFANNYCNDEKISKQIISLMLFTVNSKFWRIVNSRLYFPDILVSKDAKGFDYAFQYNGKTYPFSVFSDNKLQKFDKKTLASPKRMEACLFRTLKLACSMDLIYPRVAIGNSLTGPLEVLITFKENGIDKVIDYARNLIMSKDDYYEVFKFEELNVVDKVQLYYIYSIMKALDDFDHLYEYLMFTKDKFSELAEKEDFKFLAEKFDKNGYNRNNCIIYDNYCDALYFQKEDHNRKYKKIIDELDEFTKNPTKKNKHITYDKNKAAYVLKAQNFGTITFHLLSELINDEQIKARLLSSDRSEECHIDANILARYLSILDEESYYIVGGKTKVNENDYFYHSWIETEKYVIDFTYNLIMLKKDYYKLFEIVAISKKSVLEMQDIMETVEDVGLNMDLMDLNYFGSEIMRDLKKNERIFKNKI